MKNFLCILVCRFLSIKIAACHAISLADDVDGDDDDDVYDGAAGEFRPKAA